MSDWIEANVEAPVCDFAKKNGWIVRKLAWVGRRGGPDRFFAKDGKVILVEFKRPGKEPGTLQAREHRRLRASGVDVRVVDSVEDGRAIFR